MTAIQLRCRVCGYGRGDRNDEDCKFCGNRDWRHHCTGCSRNLEDIFCPDCGGLVRPEVVSLGSAMQGASVRFDAEVRNGGRQRIAVVLSAPGAVTLDLDHLDLAGHATARVTGQVLTGRLGPGIHRVAVRLDGPFPLALELCVEVLPSLRVEAIPDTLDLGRLHEGRTLRAEVRVLNHGPGVYRAEVQPRGSGVEVKPARIRVKAGEDVILRLRVRGGTPGPWRGQIDLNHEYVPLQIPLIAEVLGPELGPIRRQNLRQLARANTHDRAFTLTNTGVSPLLVRVASAVTWLQPLTPELTIHPGRQRRLRYRVDLTAAHAGPREGHLILTSNGGNADVLVSLLVTEPGGRLVPLVPLELGTLTRPEPWPIEIPVSNTGTGILRGQLPQLPHWLHLEPLSFAVPMGETIPLRGSIDVQRAPRGEVEQLLPLQTTGGTGRLLLCFRCDLPRVELPEHLHLVGTSCEVRPITLTLRNTGPTALEGTLQTSPAWVKVEPSVLHVEPGRQLEVRVQADTSHQSPGEWPFELRVESNGWRGTIPGRVTVAQRQGRLAPIPPLLLGRVLTPQPVQRSLDLHNTGEQTLRVTLRAEQAWLALDRTEVELATGERQRVAVEIRPAGLPGGVLRGEITLTTPEESVGVLVQFERVLPLVQTPEHLDLGSAVSGLPLRAGFVVENPTARPLRLRLSTPQPGIHFPVAVLDLAAEERREILLEADLRGWEIHPHRFCITLTEESGAVHEMTCTLEVRAASAKPLRFEPSRLVGVMIEPGQPRAIPLAVHWPGSVALDLPAQQIDGPVRVTVPAVRLEPGASRTLTLELRPGTQSRPEAPIDLALLLHVNPAVQQEPLALQIRVRPRPDVRLVLASFLVVAALGLVAGFRVHSLMLGGLLAALLARLLGRLWSGWSSGLGGDLFALLASPAVLLVASSAPFDWLRPVALLLGMALVGLLSRGHKGWPPAWGLWVLSSLATLGCLWLALS